MDRSAPDPPDDHVHGEDGGLLPAHFTPAQLRDAATYPPKLIPWEEAVEWTFAPMAPPTDRSSMSQVACPHYPPENATGPTYICRGCNAEIGNPASRQAQETGLVRGDGRGRTINQHNANPTRKLS